LGQRQWQCQKCFKTYLCINVESLCANYKPTARELSQWRVRVKAERFKGFERLKLTAAEKQLVQDIREGKKFFG
jgi:hypothetical protein